MIDQPLSLHGVFPPIITPFDREGEIDYPALERNLKRWETQPLAGYVVGGSSGEFPLLTPDERVDLVARVRQGSEASRLLIAGSGMESTRATIALGERMAQAGADALIVVTPSYYRGRMRDLELIEHYLQVAEGSPLPVILYSVPANTAVDLSAEAVIAAAQDPRIIGIKEGSGSLATMGKIIRQAPPGFQVLCPSGAYLLPALSIGAVGVVAAMANFAAERLHALMEEFRVGAVERARKIQHALIDPNQAVTAGYGIPGLKAVMDLLGYEGGRVRAPLIDLTEQDRDKLRKIVQKAGLLV